MGGFSATDPTYSGFSDPDDGGRRPAAADRKDYERRNLRNRWCPRHRILLQRVTRRRARRKPEA